MTDVRQPLTSWSLRVYWRETLIQDCYRLHLHSITFGVVSIRHTIVKYSFTIFIITLPTLIYWQPASSHYPWSSTGNHHHISCAHLRGYRNNFVDLVVILRHLYVLCYSGGHNSSTFSSSWSNIFTLSSQWHHTSHLHGSSSNHPQRIRAPCW